MVFAYPGVDEAILLDSTNIEIRLLKYYVFDNVPSIIGYSDDAKSERNAIYNLVEQLNENLDTWVGTQVIKELIKGKLIETEEANQMRERILVDNE